MSEPDEQVTQSEAKPKKRRLWLKVLVTLFVLFVVTLTGLYFYISSPAFVREMVFSEVEKKLNQPVKAEEINFSPFSEIELGDFVVGDDPFLQAEKVKIAYEVMPLLSENKVQVNELSFENVEMNVIVNRDGRLNILSKIVEEIKDEEDEEEGDKEDKPNDEDKKDKEDKPEKKDLVFDVSNISFKNLTVRYFKDDSKEEKRLELHLKDFNFSLPSFKSGEEFDFAFQTALEAAAGENFKLKKGNISFQGKSLLNSELSPEKFQFDMKVTGLDAVHNNTELPIAGLNVSSKINLSAGKINIEEFQLRNLDESSNSAVVVKGGVNHSDHSVDLNVNINNVDASLLDLAVPALAGSKQFNRWQEALSKATQGKVAGFGPAVVNFTGTVKGNMKAGVTAAGTFNLASLPLVKMGASGHAGNMAPVNINLNYSASYDADKELATLESLDLKVDEKGRKLVNMSLESALNYDIKNSRLNSSGADAVTFTVRNLDVGFLKPFTKEENHLWLKGGQVTTVCKLFGRDNGQQLTMDLKSFAITGLGIELNQQTFDNITLSSSCRLEVSNLSKVNVERVSFSLLKNRKEAVSFKAGGTLNVTDLVAGIKLSSLKIAPQIRKLIPDKFRQQYGLRNINLSADTLDLAYNDGNINVKGHLVTENLNLGGSQFVDSFDFSHQTSFEVSLDKEQTVTFKDFKVRALADNQPAITMNMQGRLGLHSKQVDMTLKNFIVEPGLDRFIPADLVRQYGVKNINLSTKSLALSYNTSDFSATGKVNVKRLHLGGEFFEPVVIDQLIEVDAVCGSDRQLDLKKFYYQLSPSTTSPFVVTANGKVDLNFKSSSSVLNISVPESVNVSDYLGLLKQQKPAERQKKSDSDESPSTQPRGDITVKSDTKNEAPKGSKLKLLIHTSAKEFIFDGKSVSNLKASAEIDGETYTLKDSSLLVEGALLQASGFLVNKAKKSLSIKLRTGGLIDLAPANNILNKGTPRSLSGKLAIERFEAKTSGKNDDEIISNLHAVGKVFTQDLRAKNYGNVPYVSSLIKGVLGADPADMEFQSGKVDFEFKGRRLILNECQFTGKALMISTVGDVEVRDDAYAFNLKSRAGFAGNTLLQKATQNPAFINALTKRFKEFQKFQKAFPYSADSKMFVMQKPFEFDNVINFKNENKTITEKWFNLNAVTTNFLNAFFLEVAEQAKVKELKAALAVGQGDVVGGAKGLLERFIKREVDRRLNKNEKKKDEGKRDIAEDLLDSIFNRGKKKEKPPEKKPEQQPDNKGSREENEDNSLINDLDSILNDSSKKKKKSKEKESEKKPDPKPGGQDLDKELDDILK